MYSVYQTVLSEVCMIVLFILLEQSIGKIQILGVGSEMGTPELREWNAEARVTR